MRTGQQLMNSNFNPIRAPLQHRYINQNANHLTHYYISKHCEDENDMPNISTKPMNPSRKQILNEPKSALNNKENMNLRQVSNCNNSISKIPSTTYNDPIAQNDPSLLSSSSSWSFGNTHDSHHNTSMSTNTTSNGYIHKNDAIKTKERNSLFQKLNNLVTKATNKSQQTEEAKDEDGDVIIGEQDTYTPATGNTPLLSTKITPKILSEDGYSAERITAIIGQDTFVEDYLKTLLNEEHQNNASSWYNERASYIADSDIRGDVVDWICCVGEQFELNRSTIYQSVYYFDEICSEKEVNMSHLQMVAASCLLIAIKYNEKEENVPSLYTLCKVCNKKYTPSSFKPMELKILNLLSFKLKVVLPIHFISYYIDIGCIFEDDTLGDHYNLHLNTQSTVYLTKFTTFFCDILCQSYSFYKYVPSVIALAVIVASRRALKIEPYFNNKLSSLCNYHPMQIKECFDELWNQYYSKFPEDAKKSQLLQPHSLDKCMNIDMI